MSKYLHAIAAAAVIAGGVLAASVSPVQAQSYPRVTGQGENIMIDYGPMGQGALVGGGRVMVTNPTGMDTMVIHLDSMFVQQPRAGFVPVIIGQGPNQMTIYVPQPVADQMMRAAATPRR